MILANKDNERIYVDMGNYLVKLNFYKKNDLRLKMGNYNIIMKEEFINGR